MKIIQRIKKILTKIRQEKSHNKVMIFSTSQEHLIYLYLGKLEANGIQANILNQKDSMYNAFGLFELYVNPSDVVKAKFIIDKDNE